MAPAASKLDVAGDDTARWVYSSHGIGAPMLESEHATLLAPVADSGDTSTTASDIEASDDEADSFKICFDSRPVDTVAIARAPTAAGVASIVDVQVSPEVSSPSSPFIGPTAARSGPFGPLIQVVGHALRRRKAPAASAPGQSSSTGTVVSVVNLDQGTYTAIEAPPPRRMSRRAIRRRLEVLDGMDLASRLNSDDYYERMALQLRYYGIL